MTDMQAQPMRRSAAMQLTGKRRRDSKGVAFVGVGATPKEVPPSKAKQGPRQAADVKQAGEKNMVDDIFAQLLG